MKQKVQTVYLQCIQNDNKEKIESAKTQYIVLSKTSTYKFTWVRIASTHSLSSKKQNSKKKFD